MILHRLLLITDIIPNLQSIFLHASSNVEILILFYMYKNSINVNDIPTYLIKLIYLLSIFSVLVLVPDFKKEKRTNQI